MAKIDETTVIQFNLKWFIGIIISLAVSFASFYFGFIKPDNKAIVDTVEQRFDNQDKYQKLKFEKLDEMNTKLGDVEQKVDALQRRELDELRAQVEDGTGASF